MCSTSAEADLVSRIQLRQPVHCNRSTGGRLISIGTFLTILGNYNLRRHMFGNLFAEKTSTTEVLVKVRKPIGTTLTHIPPHPHRHMPWERTEILRVILIFHHRRAQHIITGRTRLQILRTITRILTRNYPAPTQTSQSRLRALPMNPRDRNHSSPELRHILSHYFHTLNRIRI
jgi:hypothetical protein